MTSKMIDRQLVIEIIEEEQELNSADPVIVALLQRIKNKLPPPEDIRRSNTIASGSGKIGGPLGSSASLPAKRETPKSDDE